MKHLALILLISTSCLAQDNLVANGSFEGDATDVGTPRGWNPDSQEANVGAVVLDDRTAWHGRQSLRIEHRDDDDRWVRANQDGIPARPGTLYRFDARVRATGPASFIVTTRSPSSPSASTR